MKIFKSTWIISMLLSVTACVSTLEHTSESVSICKTETANGWGGEKLNWRLTSDNFEYNVVLGESKPGKKVAGIGPVLWVEVRGYTFGSAYQNPPPPMLYSPEGAILNIHGQKIKALNRMWRTDFIDGYFIPGQEQSIPVNLNIYAAESDFYYIAFPIKYIKPHDIYTIEAGKISLNGKYYTLPVASSCYNPSRWWWSPLH